MNQFIPSLHSFKGELSVSLPVKSQPIDARVVNTTQQLGEFPFNKDISGINNSLLGIGWAQSSMANGSRASSSTSYLANANDRPNLTVLINTMVTKLVSNHSFAGTKSFRDVLLTDSRTLSGMLNIFSRISTTNHKECIFYSEQIAPSTCQKRGHFIRRCYRDASDSPALWNWRSYCS